MIGSSLSPRLDAAAVNYFESATFATACPGTRYSKQLTFKLDH